LTAAALMTLSGCASAAEFYAQIQRHEDTGCSTGGQIEFFKLEAGTSACHPYPFAAEKGLGSVSATGSAVELFASVDCSGSALQTFSDTVTCSTSGLADGAGFFNALVISFNSTLAPISGGKVRRLMQLGAAAECSGVADLVLETASDACVATGATGAQAYVKHQTSADNKRIIKTLYSDPSCTALTYAELPAPLGACTSGGKLNLPSCNSGSCTAVSSELGYTITSSYVIDTAAPTSYAKLRFYRDMSCSVHQATDQDDNRPVGYEYSQYMGGDALNVWGTDEAPDVNWVYSQGADEGSNRVCPEGWVHIYNPAECQVAAAKLAIFSGGNQRQVSMPTDQRSHIIDGNWNSLYPFGCFVHEHDLWLNSALPGQHVPSVGYPLCKKATSALQPNDGGSPITSGTVGQAMYVENSGCSNIQLNGFESIECDSATERCTLYRCSECACAEAAHLEGDTCSADIFARVESFSTGLTLGDHRLFQSFYFFDTASIPAGARCGGRPVVLEGLLEACQISAQVSENPTQLGFVRVSTGYNTRTDYRESFYASGDCAAQPATTRNRRVGSCGQSAWSQDGGHYGSCTLAAGLPFEDMLARMECTSSQLDQGSSIGCPQPVTYVASEQFFDVGLGNGVDRRECSVVVMGPPGSIVAFNWNYFLTTGTKGMSPSESSTACHDEYIVLRDGGDEESRQIGPRWCGNQLPANVVFSGNTAMLEFSASSMSSRFKMWISFHYNHMAFLLPPNPSYQLGSDVHIDWTFSNSAPGWDDCEEEPVSGRHMCARSGARDHGWVGLYRNGTCEREHGDQEAFAAPGHGDDLYRLADHTMPYSAGQQLHKCYIAHRSVPAGVTTGEFTFYFGQDYQEAGWYSLRYFAGDSSGTVCEAPSEELTTQCDFEPIATANIKITPDRSSFSGATLREQLPGYELHINY